MVRLFGLLNAAAFVSVQASPFSNAGASTKDDISGVAKRATNHSIEASPESSVTSVDSTILVLARDSSSASAATWGLQGYGIPYQTLTVAQSGVDLPTLNSSASRGSYGGIIVLDALSYEYSDGWKSALTTEQWDLIHAYQTAFHVRMVRINEFPGPQFGASAGAGCCEDGVEQLISITDTSEFPTANLKKNAGLSTKGLWHYPATITDSSTTKQVAKFGPGGSQSGDSVAAVINNFQGREQFVWFISWAPDWSQTSNFLQHAHIHWMTRGLFLGKRKIHLGAQIDDVQLSTGLYWPQDTEFKIRTGDLEGHVTWQKNINGRLPSGSSFWLEFAHNGNGDIIAAVEKPTAEDVCIPDSAVDYDSPPDTALEFVKPPGTGENLWPDSLVEYGWSDTCAKLDDFASWFLDTTNLNAFGHLSHTFTHLELNNATYKDASREIHFNQAWMKQMGIDQANRFSANGLVPPAITGLHNADVIRAWTDNKIMNVVGDNTRPVLRNAQNKFHPLISTVASNGYDGLVIVPRYSTTIYYNCDTAECTTREWIETSAGSGDFNSLLAQAKIENTRYLLGLQADPYMFHQANMRQIDMPSITIGSQTGRMSLVMAWVETITQELYRLTDWPIVTLTHDQIAKYFLDRQAVDGCNPQMTYGFVNNGTSIDHVTVTASGNSCSVPIPITIPGGSAVASGGSASPDKVGSEPTIQWVTLSGSAVTLKLSELVSVE